MPSGVAAIENLVGVHICFLLSLMYLNTQDATCLCLNIAVCLIHGSLADGQVLLTIVLTYYKNKPFSIRVVKLFYFFRRKSDLLTYL